MGSILPQFEDDQCEKQFLLDVLQHRFTFSGETHDLGREIDWLSNPSTDIEWQITLHKFYYAPGLARNYVRTMDARYAACFEQLVSTWIGQTSTGFIATDVTARRVQNWIYAWHQFSRSDPHPFSEEFQMAFLESLESQVNYIVENMAPARNHRTLALYAVFLAAVAMPQLEAAADWLQFATKEMIKNIETDLLPDGVHCELSTDYHHIVLRSYLLFLQLAELNRVSVPDSTKKAVCRALDFAMHVHRPDGKIPALSDSDSRSYLPLLSWGAELFGRHDYAFVASAGMQGVPPPSQHAVFRDSGYVVLRSQWTRREAMNQARYLVMDAGPIGAGNHGHLDALSIEVAAYGRPLIVDPGRYTYHEQGGTNWRARFRCTSAHNTVTVNETDQAIYRQPIKKKKKVILKPHPDTSLPVCQLDDKCSYVHGRISSPNYSAIHHRHIWFFDDRYWVILDRMIAPVQHRYDLRYQFTPEAQDRVSMEKALSSTTVHIPGMALLIAADAMVVRLEESYVSELYGIKHNAPRLCARTNGADVNIVSVLYPGSSVSAAMHVSIKDDEKTILVVNHGQHDLWRINDREQSVQLQSGNFSKSWHLAAADHHGH